MLSVEKIVWYFFIYGFLGWCTEVIYAALIQKRFVNRGFLNGPICPIYGFGVLLVLHLLRPFQENLFLLFGGSVLITSAIEFIGGFAMEKLFHQRWWDYSKEPFNLMGYICLSFSILWGLACLIVVDRINPIVVYLVSKIPNFSGKLILAGVGILFLADFIATLRAVLKFNAKLKALDEITKRLREASDDIGEKLADTTLSVMERSEEVKERFEEQKEEFKEDWLDLKKRGKEFKKQNREELKRLKVALLEKSYYSQRRLLKAFPSMRSTKYEEALYELKLYLELEKNKPLS